jgi:hypothetical protein
VPLETLSAAHIRVTCDACRSVDAEVCGKRDLPLMARVAAVRKFRAAGWRHEPSEYARIEALGDARRDGLGRWFCPACAQSIHP